MLESMNQLLSKNRKVLILLAAYNGEKYIAEQIESLLNQRFVQVEIVINIDLSSDSTFEICNKYQDQNVYVINTGMKFGNAQSNFYYLWNFAYNSNIEYDYIAFCDQDDIWHKDKLFEGLKLMESSNSNFYSSNLNVFFEDGSRDIIVKQPSKKFEHLFSSASAGCTFILERNFFCFVVIEIDKYSILKNFKCHDWLIFLLAKENAFIHVHDNRFFIDYRQHDNNVAGANIGLKNKLRRLFIMFGGWYYQDVIVSLRYRLMKGSSIRDLLFSPFQLRSNRFESLLIYFYFLLIYFKV